MLKYPSDGLEGMYDPSSKRLRLSEISHITSLGYSMIPKEKLPARRDSFSLWTLSLIVLIGGRDRRKLSQKSFGIGMNT